MAKNNEKTQPSPAKPVAGETLPPAPPAPAPEPQSRLVTRWQLLSFWGVVLLMVATAWLLDRLMPNTPERLVERWLMLPFGAFLVYFLYRLK